MKLKLYLAGPLFTLAEHQFNVDLSFALQEYGFQCLVPQVFCEHLEVARLCPKCLEQLACSDVIVVNCDGPDVESGTAFEAGWAKAREIPIVAYRTDFRAAGDDRTKPVNLMIGQS